MKRISIIGAAGRMGSWFSIYLSKLSNYDLYLYDTNPIKTNLGNAIICENIETCISDSDVVILCTPIHSTPLLIEYCSSKMKKDSYIVEISSIKERSFPSLKNTPININPICIHPMFGQGVTNINNIKIILIPVRDKEKEFSLVNILFNGANIIFVSTYKEHDKMMAMVLGVTHFSNILFGNLITKNHLTGLKEIAGTTFKIQSVLCEAIFSDSPDLIASLLVGNSELDYLLKEYLQECQKLTEIILNKKSDLLLYQIEKVKSSLTISSNLDQSYRKMYKMLDVILDDIDGCK